MSSPDIPDVPPPDETSAATPDGSHEDTSAEYPSPYKTPVGPMLDHPLYLEEVSGGKFPEFLENVETAVATVEGLRRVEEEMSAVLANIRPRFPSDTWITLRNAIRASGSDFYGNPMKNPDLSSVRKNMAVISEFYLERHKAMLRLMEVGGLSKDIALLAIVELREDIIENIGGSFPNMLSFNNNCLVVRKGIWNVLADSLGVKIQPTEDKTPNGVYYREFRKMLTPQQRADMLGKRIALFLSATADDSEIQTEMTIDAILGISITRKLL